MSTYIDIELLKQLYSDGLSSREIERRTGINYKTVMRHLKRAGVQMRGVGGRISADKRSLLATKHPVQQPDPGPLADVHARLARIEAQLDRIEALMTTR